MYLVYMYVRTNFEVLSGVQQYIQKKGRAVCMTHLVWGWVGVGFCLHTIEQAKQMATPKPNTQTIGPTQKNASIQQLPTVSVRRLPQPLHGACRKKKNGQDAIGS